MLKESLHTTSDVSKKVVDLIQFQKKWSSSLSGIKGDITCQERSFGSTGKAAIVHNGTNLLQLNKQLLEVP